MKDIPIITLLTDFGLDDEYVGVMKGVLLSGLREIHIVDITHQVPRHDIRQAALVLKSAYSYFPSGTIHICVVDPGVGGERTILCLEHNGHTFIAPDNGLLTLVVQEGPPGKIYEVTNRAFFLNTVSHTFHGRDIFAAVAAHVAKGVDISELGPHRTHRDITLFDISPPSLSPDGQIIGEIISMDHFGNLITSIDRPTFCSVFPELSDHIETREVLISLSGIQVYGVSPSYESVAPGAPLAIFGSRNLLEISLNQGNAQSYFNARLGQKVTIIAGRPGNEA